MDEGAWAHGGSHTMSELLGRDFWARLGANGRWWVHGGSQTMSELLGRDSALG